MTKLTMVIRDGKPANGPQILAKLASLPDGRYTLSITPWQARPTAEQRGLYWAEIVEDYRAKCGYVTANEAHEKLVQTILALFDTQRPSTSDREMGRDDYSDLIERAYALLATSECPEDV